MPPQAVLISSVFLGRPAGRWSIFSRTEV